jgi:hypothetical protein
MLKYIPMFYIVCDLFLRFKQMALSETSAYCMYEMVYFLCQERSECKGAKNACGNSLYSATVYKFPVLLKFCKDYRK